MGTDSICALVFRAATIATLRGDDNETDIRPTSQSRSTHERFYMSRNDEIYYTNEGTFKTKLRKLYKIALNEGLALNIDLTTYRFISCEAFNDILDVNYTNGEKDFALSVRGGERLGYRILTCSLDDALTDDDYT